MVEIYKGKNIDDEKIRFLKYISSKKYSKEIYDEYFKDINSVKDLANLHITTIKDECLAKGTDWFLCYNEFEYAVNILEWVSINNENTVKQAIEMIELFKKIFFQNKNKIFIADMRHDTSYTLYLKMIQRGYFKEIKNHCIIDCAAPPEVQKLKLEILEKFNSIENFLSSNLANSYSQHFKYILHHISFIISPNFIKKYANEVKSKERVLK